MNIPSLLHQRELALLSIPLSLNNTTSSAVSPASVVTKCKPRLSGSNVSHLTGVFVIIWLICWLAPQVSSSVVVSCWQQLKPNFGSSGERRPSSEASESWLSRPLQQGFWLSEDISCFVSFFSQWKDLGFYKIAQLLMTDYFPTSTSHPATSAGWRSSPCKFKAFILQT